MLFIDNSHYYLCCEKGLIRVMDDSVTSILDGTEVRSISRIDDHTVLIGTYDKGLKVVNSNTMTVAN